jgi:hypothetical protein
VRSRHILRIGIISSFILAISSLTALGGASASHATQLGPAAIVIDVDPATAGVQTQVAYMAGEAIAVHALIEGAEGVGAYGLEVQFGGQLNLTGWSDGDFLASTGRMPSCFEILTDTSADIGCGTLGAEPAPPSGDGVLAIFNFNTAGAGVGCITPVDAELADVDGEPLAVTAAGACISVFPEGSTDCTNPLLPHEIDVDGDTLTNAEEAVLGTDPCNADTDGDLCNDWAELNADPINGGGRDPLNGYDFYDVNANGKVDAGDIGRVRVSVGLSLGDPGYTTLRDRSYIGPDPWDLGPPDGVIDDADLAAVRGQFGHSCPPPETGGGDPD